MGARLSNEERERLENPLYLKMPAGHGARSPAETVRGERVVLPNYRIPGRLRRSGKGNV